MFAIDFTEAVRGALDIRVYQDGDKYGWKMASIVDSLRSPYLDAAQKK